LHHSRSVTSKDSLSIPHPFANLESHLNFPDRSKFRGVNLGTFKEAHQVLVGKKECDCSFVLTIASYNVQRQQRIVLNQETMKWGIDLFEQPRITNEKHIIGCPSNCLQIPFGSEAVVDLDKERGEPNQANWRGRSRFVNQLLPICELMRNAHIDYLTIPNPQITFINPHGVHVNIERVLSAQDDPKYPAQDYEQRSMHFKAQTHTEEVSFDVKLPHSNSEHGLFPVIKLNHGIFSAPAREEHLEEYIRWLYSMFNDNIEHGIPVKC